MPQSLTDTSLASLLLTQRLATTSAKPLKAAEYWPLTARLDGDPAKLLGLHADAVAQMTGLDLGQSTRVVRLLDAATAFAFALEEANRRGLHLVTAVDDAYPRKLTSRLGSAAPPVIYAYGNLELLATNLVGVVGARNVTEAGAHVARQAGEFAAQRELGVVSGCARGCDREAMTRALRQGGRVVGIPASPLTHTAHDRRWRDAILDGRACLWSPYGPQVAFSVARAHGRNPLIYALSAVTLVVAADAGSGGTWTGAAEALANQVAPVAVWAGDGGGPGNQRLVERGGAAVGAVADLARFTSA